MNRLKKGDQVYIISGKDKGKTGTVNRLTQDDKVLVDGINLVCLLYTSPSPRDRG